MRYLIRGLPSNPVYVFFLDTLDNKFRGGMCSHHSTWSGHWQGVAFLAYLKSSGDELFAYALVHLWSSFRPWQQSLSYSSLGPVGLEAGWGTLGLTWLIILAEEICNVLQNLRLETWRYSEVGCWDGENPRLETWRYAKVEYWGGEAYVSHFLIYFSESIVMTHYSGGRVMKWGIRLLKVSVYFSVTTVNGNV